ncbi:hypothetical protein [Rugosimonospora africana]|nr:hypothetical protein [Rugosimonospora africana]
MVDDDRVAAVARLWQAHLRAPFPPSLRGAEIAGIDMVLLDADTAGCVRTWLQHTSQRASESGTRMSIRLGNLDRVLPLLTDPLEVRYYRRLRDLANLICELPS